MLQIRIRAFRAIDDIQTCKKYIKGHVEVLKGFSITNITSNSPDWIWNPSVYGVIAESMDGTEVYGGVRVHVSDNVHMLPVEDAVTELDPRIHERVKQYAVNGTGEACAQWNSRDVSGMGLSVLLIRSVISIVTQIGLTSLFGICADYTLQMFQKVGYNIVPDLGNNGEFVYPNSNYVARVILMDPINLTTAEAENREHIFLLRENPNLKRIEKGPKGEIEVQYDLVVPDL